ncbi:SCO4848 family membrane protein [Microbacterium rhizomatis]|uniref:Integral membrane protein n=1 Tax=Microbacterium rhizomatis TaxID=1631477 RepID=A0A5J5J4A8_9MICO|nr:hypothetical protein [Microbacterium rhizomatis]KAA9110289.1 hypothetical protein F6B43_00885 [Microbacterium rhizomatis]
MTIAIALLLFANAVFNVVAWPQFLRRVANDPRSRDAAGRATPFLRVHMILVAIALVLAAASLAGGIWILVA